jgi:hypothetical protein
VYNKCVTELRVGISLASQHSSSQSVYVNYTETIRTVMLFGTSQCMKYLLCSVRYDANEICSCFATLELVF